MNYYEILEITENASLEVIKAAYRALAKKYHPDSYSGVEVEREKNMILINKAYAVLSDTQKRKEYDLKLKSQSSNKSDSQREKATESQQHNTYYEEQRATNIYQNNQSRYSQSKSNESSKQNDYYSYDKEHEADEESQGSGWFGRVVRGVGKEFVKTIQNNNREIENAYLDGISMDDYTLVRRFKQAKGYRRVGYAKALEEKDLLERDYDGKLVPTYKYKHMF